MGSYISKPTVVKPKTLFQATQMQPNTRLHERASTKNKLDETIIDLTQDDSDGSSSPSIKIELFDALAVANRAAFRAKRKGKANASLEKASEAAFLAAFPRIQKQVSDRVVYAERTREDQRRLLEDEYIAVQHEIQISQLVNACHNCDDWDDIFKDNIPRLKEKCRGIRLALEALYDIEEY